MGVAGVTEGGCRTSPGTAGGYFLPVKKYTNMPVCLIVILICPDIYVSCSYEMQMMLVMFWLFRCQRLCSDSPGIWVRSQCVPDILCHQCYTQHM